MNSKHDHTELVNKILTGARWATVLRFGAQIFSWLSTIIVVRFISPVDYGLNSMLSSPLVLMMLLSTLGLETVLVQAKKIKDEELQNIFGWLLILNGLLFLAYFFGGVVLASYFREPRLDLLAKSLAFIFLLVPFRVIPNALLDRELDFKLRAQLEITASLVAAVATVSMAYFGAGIWALVIGVLVSKTLLTILLMVFKPWFIVPKFNWATISPMMSVGGIILLSGFLTLLSDQLINFVAGPVLGASLLGIYGMSSELASLPLSKFMPVINQTMLPAFSKLQEHRESATYYLEKLLGVTSLAFIPMMVGMACVADTLVMTFFGEKWAPSILPLVIMTFGMIFRMTTIQLKTVVTGMGRADLQLKSNLLQLALLLPMTIYAVRYGVVGLMVAWVITEVLVMFATVVLSKAVLDISFTRLLRCYRPALVSSLLMSLTVFGCKFMLGNQAGIAALLIMISMGVVSYYFSARILFLNEFRAAFKAVFGNRFSFLAGRLV
jgi:O-antigen/teichoic acid export membrane protein